MPRIAWAKASSQDIHNYRSTLSNMLNSIDIPNDTLLCNDLQCKDPNHVYAIAIAICNMHMQMILLTLVWLLQGLLCRSPTVNSRVGAFLGCLNRSSL